VTYTKSATMVGTDMGSQTQSIGTSSSETLDVPVDVSTPYKLLISNLDNTNYVELSFTSGFLAGAGTMRLPAGETMLIPYINTNLYLIANTSAVTIQATFCEV
jgi:hypothetical protein